MWDPQPDTIRFGVLLPLNAIDHYLEASVVRRSLSAIRMAVDDINRQGIIPGANVTLVLRDSQSPDLFTSSGGAAAIAGAGALISAKVTGVIGDISSDLTRYEALMTSSVKIPHCSYASINTILSDEVMYPWFFRTIPTTIVILDAALDLILKLGWRRITLIYDVDIIGWAGREYFAGRAKKLGIYVLGYQPIRLQGQADDPTFQFIKDKIDSSQSRIQLLVSVGPSQTKILREMNKSGYLGPEYGWVTMNDIAETLRKEPDHTGYDGLIMLDNDYNLTGNPAYDKFMEQWMALDIRDYPGAAHDVINSNEAMAYSCVMMIANAYADLVKKTIGDHASINDTFLREIMAGEHTEDVHVSKFYSKKSYNGPSGRVLLDVNGDRQEGPYRVLSLQDGESIPFALIFGSNYTSLMPPPFKTGHKRLPNDAPLWAIQNPRWSNSLGKVMGILCLCAILLTVATSTMVFYFRRHIVIKAASPVFCLCELMGLLLVYIWCFMHVGIPSFANCAAQAFMIPIGITLLTGSLTFKNYRIYRIFNSITVTNRIFHTGRLLKFLAVAVILTAIPSLVEVLVYPPIPNTINSNYDQWIRCRSPSVGVWRLLVSAVVPIFLVIFGVFLAFKTRNVMFLWNEAREISLVIYNIFFFGLLIVIFQFFSDDLYIATFYMTVAGTFFTATLALLCLFLPKFWGLLKSYQERDENDTTHSWRGGGPTPVRQPRLGSTGYLLADSPVSSGGSCGGNIGGLGGLGGSGGAGGNYVSARSSLLSANTLGRMRDDLDFTGFPTATSTLTNSQLSKPKPPSLGAKVGMDDAAAATAVGVDLSDPMDISLTSQSIIQPRLTRATTISLEHGMRTAHSRRRSDALSVASPGNLGGHSGNPIDLWMSAQLPSRKKSSVGHLSTTKDSALTTGSISGLPHPQFVRRDFSDDIHQDGSERSQKLQDEGAGVARQNPMQCALDIHSSPASYDLDSGINRCMDSFVFLLPIRVKKSWVTGVLSHWCMATLILIPEAHAFLALDSADNKLTSYLMTQMAQDYSTPDPTIRVNTCHSGILFIRFETQSRLDAWMALFDEEDLNALRLRTASLLPSTSLTSSFDQIPPQPPSAWTSSSPHSSTLPLNDKGSGMLGSGYAQDLEYGVRQSGYGSRHPVMSMGGLFSSASSLAAAEGGVAGKARSTFGESGSEMVELHVPSAAAAVAGGEADGSVWPWMNMTATASSVHPQQQQRSQWEDYQLGFGSSAEKEDKPRYRDNNNASGDSFNATGTTPMIDPRSSHQYNSSVSEDITIPTISSSAIFSARPDNLPFNSTASNSNRNSTYSIPSTTNLNGDDDEEDLYDPEFGIGGNGRRRFRNRNCSAVSGCSSTFSSTASSTRSSMVVNSSAARPLSKAAGMVPSPAVISTAAAACAAGWKESDALAAATADPSGSFLPGYNTTSPALQYPGSSRNSNRGSRAGTRASPVRKSFGDFRLNNSLSSGLSLLASGRQSLGQIFLANSGNSNSVETVAERSTEVVVPVGSWNDKVLSYSQYLTQTQAAVAAAATTHQSQLQQPSHLPPQMPVVPKAEVLMAPPATAPTTDSVTVTALAAPPLAADYSTTVLHSADASATPGPDQN
ncbi:hypothetical protein BGZ89_008759 [Linnemannia elongata]|nr:hypothetical protein BGZ89_008759 [Linnemannia elongata]